MSVIQIKMYTHSETILCDGLGELEILKPSAKPKPKPKPISQSLKHS